MWGALCALLFISETTMAEGDVYQSVDAFLAETFVGDVPAPEVLWLTGDIKSTVADILGHAPNILRARYWRRDGRSAWILEEIGKVEPITTGLVVNNGRIEGIKVLIYRESRGWEVRYPFFTDQFRGATLAADHRLDRNIDGISGATLSVNALTKLSRIALFLHSQTEDPSG